MDVKRPADSQDVGSSVASSRARELQRHEQLSASLADMQDSGQAIQPTIYRLRQQLKGIPEVRVEIVVEATNRLREKYFLTRESAVRTAEAILQGAAKD